MILIKFIYVKKQQKLIYKAKYMQIYETWII